MTVTRYPRCNQCGKRLLGLDLWVSRYATSVPLSVRKKCSRCNAKEGDKDNE
jgi:DNA-directed RNA polymerase subunit RPC12/RpoP